MAFDHSSLALLSNHTKIKTIFHFDALELWRLELENDNIRESSSSLLIGWDDDSWSDPTIKICTRNCKRPKWGYMYPSIKHVDVKNQTSIIRWCIRRRLIIVSNKHQKHTCFDEIGVCAHLIINKLIQVQQINQYNREKLICNHFFSLKKGQKVLFTLNFCSFWIPTPTPTLGKTNFHDSQLSTEPDETIKGPIQSSRWRCPLETGPLIGQSNASSSG